MSIKQPTIKFPTGHDLEKKVNDFIMACRRKGVVIAKLYKLQLTGENKDKHLMRESLDFYKHLADAINGLDNYGSLINLPKVCAKLKEYFLRIAKGGKQRVIIEQIFGELDEMFYIH